MTSKIHWDTIPGSLPIPGMNNGFSVFAVWPETVNRDECFEKAGFSSWTDDDLGFRELVGRSLEVLSAAGVPQLRSSDEMIYPMGLWGKLLNSLHLRRKPAAPTLFDYLFQARDDQFKPCIVDFGPRAQATLISAGHDLIWLGLSSSWAARAQHLLSEIAKGRKLDQRSLDWKVLVRKFEETA